MIDRTPDSPLDLNAGRAASQNAGPDNSDTSEVYSDLFGGPGGDSREYTEPPAPCVELPETEAPLSPHTLARSGLTLMQVGDLVMKQLHLHGQLLGVDVARHIRLPFQVVDEALRFLKDHKIIEVSSGDVIGTASYRFSLTELGRRRSREALEHCGYVGPAPVSLEQYVDQCRRQTVSTIDCDPVRLQEAFSQLVIRQHLLEELGPAVCSGKSIFIYGPPGNGKTRIAIGLGRFLNRYGGDIYVPYAIQTDSQIITVYDPTIHESTDDLDVAGDLAGYMTGQQGYTDGHVDLRWRRIRRPVVITGGELTLAMLDLQHFASSNFYTAPLHIKANGGVFLVDDFGRQIVSPSDLLNRWILPLEEGIDYLSLSTGKKFSVPFEQLIIFSTNLDPRELVDEAFLRRIRHKIEIGSPERELFTDIFKLTCELKTIHFNAAVVEYLFTNYYDHGKPPRSSDPRDLLEIISSICRFRRQPVLLTPELMAEAASRFFCQI